MWKRNTIWVPRLFIVEFVVFLASISIPVRGLLQCACTTADCRAEGAVRCVATSMCYVQYLDRGDGDSPWSRGCIDGIANSLLCENQPPAAGKGGASRRSGKGKRKSARGGGRGRGDAPLLWPLIHCCSTSFCNSEEFSASYPVWMKKKFGRNGTLASNSLLDEESSPMNSYDPTILANDNDNDNYHLPNNSLDADSPPVRDRFSSSSSTNRNDDPEDENDNDEDDSYYYYQPKVLTFGETVNPIYIAVPAVGACILVIIVIFAFYLLRKHAAGGGGVVGGRHRRHVGGSGPASTPSLLSSSPFLYVDHHSRHSQGAPDCCYCESSSSSSTLYCNHDHHNHHNHHHLHQNNPTYNHHHPQQHPPKYDEAFLNPASQALNPASHALNAASHGLNPSSPPFSIHQHHPPYFQHCPSKTSHASDPTLSSSRPPGSLLTDPSIPIDVPPSYVPRPLIATMENGQIVKTPLL